MKNYIVKSLFLVTLLSLGACKNETPQKLTEGKTNKEVVSFERISSYIWRESLYDLGKLRTLIYRLKQKLGFEIIENIFESGYKLKVK